MTALKTLTARLRAAKTELEEAGEDTEGMAESVSKLRDEMLALTGGRVDLIDPNTNGFKSTYEIMKELASVWEQLSDVSKANILERVAGKRLSNVAAAIITQFDVAEKSLATSMDAAGSALEENSRYLESIEGKTKQLTASWQEFSNALLDNALVKGAVDAVRWIVDGINNINRETDNFISKIGDVLVGIGGIITLISVIRAAVNKIKVGAGIAASIDKIKKLIITLGGLKTTIEADEIAAMSLSATLAKVGLSIPHLITIMAALAVVVAAVAAGYKAWKEAHPSTADLIDTAEQARLEVESLNSELDTLKSKIDEINGLENPTVADEADLKRLQKENDELERRLRILEREQELSDEAVENAVLGDIKTAEQQSAATTKTMNIGGSSFEYDGAKTDAVSITNLKKRTEEVTRLTKELRQAEAELDAAGKLSSEIEGQNSDKAKAWSELSAQMLAQSISVEEYYQKSAELKEKYGDVVSIDEADEKYTSAKNKVEDLEQALRDATNSAKEMHDAVGAQYGELSKLKNISEESKEKLDSYTEASIKYSQSIGAIDTEQDIRSIFNMYKFEELKNKLDDLRKNYVLTGKRLGSMLLEESTSGLGESGPVHLFLKMLEEIAGVQFDKTEEGLQELIDILYGATDAASGLEKGIKFDTADDIKERIDAINSALNDFKTYGKLTQSTVDELQKQMPNVIKYLYDEKGRLTDVGKAALTSALQLNNNVEASKQLQIAATKASYANIINEIKKVGNAAKITAIQLEAMAQSAGIDTSTPIGQAQLKGMKLTAKLQGTTAVDELLKYLDAKTREELKNLNALYEGVSGGDSSGSSGSTSNDPFKDGQEKELRRLKHLLEMEAITQEEYYDKVAAVRDKYLAKGEKYTEEVWDLDEELFSGRLSILEDYINDNNRLAEKFANVGNIEAEEEIYETTLSHINDAIEQALKEGYDENGEFVQKLRDLYKDAAEKITQTMMDAWSDYESYMDNFNLWNNSAFTKNSFYESWLKKINDKKTAGYYDGREMDYINDYNDVAQKLADNTRESINTVISTVIDLIEKEADEYADALDDQIGKLSDIINLKKELLEQTKSQLDHEEDVAERVREISKLQSRINQLALDDSREAAAKRAELEEELYAKTRDFERSQREFGYEQTSQALDDALDLQEKNAEALKKVKEKEIDTWQKKYDLAIKMIDEDWAGTYSKIIDYSKEFSNSIDGQDSIKTACDNVTESIKEWGVQLKNIEGIYKGVGETLGKAPSIASVGADGSVNLTGTSNLPASQNPYKAEVEGLLKQMEANSKEWHNSDAEGRKTLEQRNQQIGKNELPRYGIVPTYDDGDWKLGNELLYDWARKNGYVFHKGGVVGANGKFGEEVMAVVKTGELVLTEEQQRNLAKVLSGPNQALMSILGTYTMHPGKMAGVGGDTFAPSIGVTINHNGSMSDSDAKRYGDTVANTALEKLREAFVKRGKS